MSSPLPGALDDGRVRDDMALVRLVHQPVRQAILRALAERNVLSFAEIKRITSITDGNLSVHAHKLVDAGVLTCTKSFRGQLPRTEYGLTPAGKLAVARLLPPERPATGPTPLGAAERSRSPLSGRGAPSSCG